MGDLVWKVLWENQVRPFMFQKIVYLSGGFVGCGSVWVGLR